MADQNEYFSAIAHELGGKYDPRDGATWGTITLADGVAFWISGNQFHNKGRAEVSPRFPQHETGTGFQHTIQRDFDKAVPYHQPALANITFSLDKAPHLAAREIERRYLKAYRPLYAQAVAWCDSQTAYYSAKRSIEQAARHHLAPVRYSESRRVYADLGYVGGGECTVNVHGLCAADVAKLAEFLAGL